MPAARKAQRTGLVFGSALTLLAAALLLAGLPPARAEPTLPTFAGRITDAANLLTAEDRAQIEADLAKLEQTATDQLAIVTLDSLQGYTIEDFGYELGRKWVIGQKGKDNGVVLVVAPKERKVRIEVGRGLEPILTDALSKLIIENAIIPEFRRGDFPAGIRAGVRDIKDVLLGDAEEVKQRARNAQGPYAPDTMQVILLIFWALMVAYIIWAVYRSAQNAKKSGLRRGGDSAVVPGSAGGWDGGGWSGGGGGDGGGWSGGGGSFGGGGSSGSW